ncbi:hypothetical protein F5880DRAFT_1645221, partial [Lentinula raphanica]
MEPSPKSFTAAAIKEEESLYAAAATCYDFSDYDFGGTVHLSYRSPPSPDDASDRLGEQEAFALLAGEGGDTSRVETSPVDHSRTGNKSAASIPTFIDSGASHWCIRNRSRFISYTPVKSSGRMATEGQTGSFEIEGYGIAEITVKTNQGSIHRLRFPASHTPSFTMNLLSLPSMDKKGLKGEWGSGRIDVKDPKTGKVIVDGHIVGRRGGHGLYQVTVVDSLDGPQSTLSSSAVDADSTFVLASSGKSR